MKIATGIIGLFLGILVLMQSCAVAAGGGLMDDQAISGAGMIGIFVGLVFFIGGAFSFALPLVSGIIFVIAALFAFLASAQGMYSDMKVWGVIALLLAAMSFFTWRSIKKKQIRI